MTRSRILAVFAMISGAACSAADPAERTPVDAGRDTRTTPRADALADQNDARGADVADDGAPDVDGAADAVIPPADAPSDRSDAATGDGAAPDAPALPDAPISDVAPPRDADASPPLDATADAAITTCFVSFTVSGVLWDAEAGAPDAAPSARIVRVVGDAANLGAWTPSAGVPLAEISPSTWSGTANLRDGQLIEFKFVKLQGSTPEWENWQPYDSNRSLRVVCPADGGVLVDAGDGATPSDAAGDAADANGDISIADGLSDVVADSATPDATFDASDSISDSPVTSVPARGHSYTGAFGVRPPDATK